jgi:2-dehydro-3-deoxyphosphooctonate aldolase (KDO 8-P synthase)
MHPWVNDLFVQRKFTLIAGPCVIESYELCKEVAQFVQAQCQAHEIGFIFKSSFDKANRTSSKSFRGHGIHEGLQILARIRDELGVPVITDIHESTQAKPVSEVADVLQIPAFLCRQTDLLLAAADTGTPTAIKKGQFLAPEDMAYAVGKFREGGGKHVAVMERGTTFGYHNLVVDFRSLGIMREVTQAPVIFDATHSVQRPSSGGSVTGGDRHIAPVLARAASAVGIDGLYAEVHPDPDKALSDGPNSLNFPMLAKMLDEVVAITRLVSKAID